MKTDTQFHILADYNEVCELRGFFIVDDFRKPVLRLYLRDYDLDEDACYKHAQQITKLLNYDN